MTDLAQAFTRGTAFAWEERDINPYGAAGLEALRRGGEITSAATDTAPIELLGIDEQDDFCHPAGALYVGGRDGRGAYEDTYRVAQFIYRNIFRISRITLTLDTHVPGQVFFTSFWVDENGNEPAPFTVITADDVRLGRFRPSEFARSVVPEYLDDHPGQGEAWIGRQAEHYVDALTEGGKYALVLWPYHCLLGTPGHAVARPILEASLLHSLVRGAPFVPVTKGDVPWTESYSVFRNEVEQDHMQVPFPDNGGKRLAHRLSDISQTSAVIVAGQAASHCVMSSLDDLLEYGTRIDGAFPSRVYVMRDCMSSVVTKDADGNIIPGLDFTDAAEAAFDRWAAAGVNIVESTVAMEEWPGMADILERNGRRVPSLA